MLTWADDYPIHRDPEPVACASTDPDFYERYFFNGYTPDGTGFLAVTLGVYPQRGVMDAAFSVIRDGQQHNLRASRALDSDRMATSVGPIGIEVVEPLRALRVSVDDAEHGIQADLTFRARAPILQEPRFTRRADSRTVMDYTRMTQHGTWEGWYKLDGKIVTVRASQWLGTRDRSWGVRPVGEVHPWPAGPDRTPQFFWLSSSLNFDDSVTLYYVDADDKGEPLNTHALSCPLGGRDLRYMDDARADVTWRAGTRHAERAVLHFVRHDLAETRIELEPKFRFYMSGLGYGHPEWGHGMDRGELDVGYDVYPLNEVDENDRLHLHVQSFVRARMTGGLGERQGCGVLEQLVIGPHEPSGF